MAELVNTYTPSEIRAFSYSHLYLSVPVTIVSGQDLAKGTVLGKITASGKYTAYASTNANGSETAEGILAQAVDASSTGANADTPASMYVKGVFVESKLTGYDATAKSTLGAREYGSFVDLP